MIKNSHEANRVRVNLNILNTESMQWEYELVQGALLTYIHSHIMSQL